VTGEDRGAGGVLDLFRLDGRVVIVTGASSGLGVAFAAAFAQAGADLVVAARRAERLNATAAQVEAAGRSCLSVPADVTDPGVPGRRRRRTGSLRARRHPRQQRRCRCRCPRDQGER
jgi:NAD(P)-dependent dehydrogenase (short-subunit alcohol dehydrogenase family)